MAIYQDTVEEISSVSTSHFTGALAAGAVENENISIPWNGCNKLLIHRAIMTIDNTNTTALVPFYLNFYGTDAFVGAIDTEKWLGRIEFAEADFEQIGASGLYRGARDLTDSPLAYIDLDYTNEIHMQLENTDASQAWHVDDEVKVTLIVSPVL